MFSLNPMKELYESPLPPMALTDYEAFSKFLNQALHCCHETGRDFNVYLDWAIRALASSMAADSAARIFLPKTRTAPFSLDDLIPLSEIPSKGTVRVDLTKSYVVAPIWNNTDLVDAVKAFSDSGFENAQIDQVFGGAYIQELKLAIIDSPSDVDVPYILSQWDRGSIQMPIRSRTSPRSSPRTERSGICRKRTAKQNCRSWSPVWRSSTTAVPGGSAKIDRTKSRRLPAFCFILQGCPPK